METAEVVVMCECANPTKSIAYSSNAGRTWSRSEPPHSGERLADHPEKKEPPGVASRRLHGGRRLVRPGLDTTV